MSYFTVKERTTLLPEPDPSASGSGVLSPGDRISNVNKLGDWAKISAMNDIGSPLTGWLLVTALTEVVGQKVRLHPEPLSEQFMEVTGTIVNLLDLMNWRKVNVTTATGVKSGWVDTNVIVEASRDEEPIPTDEAGPGATLNLGVNEVFRSSLLKAEEITRIDAAALAALIDAEAAKLRDGPNKGQWDPKSFNTASGAGGLTQFLASTWLDHARNRKNLLNKICKEKGLIMETEGVASSHENDILNLRFDPELSIVSAAEFGFANLKNLEDEGLLPGSIGDDDKARFMYLAHHEGLGGARAFLRNKNSNDLDKFKKQVGAKRAKSLAGAAGGDVALAYRKWLNEYMDEHIVPARFRMSGTAAPTVIKAEPRKLKKFTGKIALAALGGSGALVLEAQQALTRLGYLDPPADGKWGNVSNWALEEFCERNALSLSEGFTGDIAKALVISEKPLPEVALGGTWFDKVMAYMHRENYWICRHPEAINIVYLEGCDENGVVNNDVENVFNDLRITFRITESGKPKIVGIWEGTTEPGIFWTMKPMRTRGAARIAFGQYKSWSIGTHMRGKASAHEALVQVAEVTVHRDFNKDFKRTSDQTDTGLFGINQHWGYDAQKDDLGSTSAGCLVGRTKVGHREFMALLKADPRFDASRAYRFMSAVLPADKVIV